MATPNNDRSQPLLRIPRNQTPVTITLLDGERSAAMLFVPLGTPVLRMLADASPFIPIAFSSGTRLIARGAIACITLHVVHAHVEDYEMVGERQKAIVRLRGGQMLKGELRWISIADNRRTLDHLNDASTHLVIHDGEHVSYITKSHVASVEEV